MGKKMQKTINEIATLVLVNTLERIRVQENLTSKGVIDFLDSKGTSYLMNDTEFLFGGISDSDDETLKILKGEM